MNTRHTPGPWRIGYSDESEADSLSYEMIHITQDGDALIPIFVAGVPLPGGLEEMPDEGTPQERALADARLIAVAPDLLAELMAVEWAGIAGNPRGGYYRACPSCGGGDPGNPATPADHAGHAEDCTLAAAVRKATAGAS